jgi:hypothetical protein
MHGALVGAVLAQGRASRARANDRDTAQPRGMWPPKANPAPPSADSRLPAPGMAGLVTLTAPRARSASLSYARPLPAHRPSWTSRRRPTLCQPRISLGRRMAGGLQRKGASPACGGKSRLAPRSATFRAARGRVCHRAFVLPRCLTPHRAPVSVRFFILSRSP